MPSLEDLSSQRRPVKALLTGQPGTGKTGALASLARAGYNLHIINCDNNLDILAAVLKNDPASLARVRYVTCTNERKTGVMAPKYKGSPDAYQRALGLMDHWKEKDEDADGKDVVTHDGGRPAEWGLDHVLVIDSGTRLSDQCFDAFLHKNQKLTIDADFRDYMAPQRGMDGVWSLLTADSFFTNVLIIMHIKAVEKEIDKKMVLVGELPKGVGMAGSESVGGFFPTIIKMERSGTGDSVKRRIFTRPSGLLETKMPALEAERVYDGDDALASIFELLGGGLPATAAPRKTVKAAAKA